MPRDHDGDHPLNLRIPLALAGRGLRRGVESRRVSHLLDIPPTILASLGMPVPMSYQGRVLVEAFAPGVEAVA